MKRIIAITLLLLFSNRLTAQTEIKFDLKSEKERLVTYKVIDNKGIFIITEKKVRGLEYTMMMRMVDPEAKLLWEKELPNKALSKGSMLWINIQYNNDFIYVISVINCTNNPGCTEDQYVSTITYSGEVKTAMLDKKVLTEKDCGASPGGCFLVGNSRKGFKDIGITKVITPVNNGTLKAETPIRTDLPALEDGEWHYLDYNNDGAYFYAFKPGFNDDHSLNCEIRQVGADGKTRHTLNLKAMADGKYPSPRIKYDNDFTPPFAEIYVDSIRREIYLHGFYQTKEGAWRKGLGSAKLIPEGYYICKYGFDGVLKWNKTYSMQQLIKMGTSLRESPQLNEWKYIYFTTDKDEYIYIVISADYDPFQNAIIADTSGNFIMAAKGKWSNHEDFMGERVSCENGNYNAMRCRLFWNLKKSEKYSSQVLKASNMVKQKNGANETNTNVDAWSFEKTTLVIQMRHDTRQLNIFSVPN